MIWFNDGEKITKAEIVSKDDRKLKDFVIENGELDFKNLNYLCTEYKRGDVQFNGYGIGNVYRQYGKDIENNLVINCFKYKKLITLQMVTEALNNSGVPQLSKIAADAIIPKELEDFFENTEVGLKKIESVIDSPYFIDFIEKMYSDYAGFLEILSYIDFNPIKNYDLKSLHQIAALMEQSEKYEILHYGMEKAQNNSKILCKSKEFLRKVNK